ncbi:hypothetical protein ScPMuIL_017458 [Solemya velum]
MFLLYVLLLSLSGADTQEHTLSDTIYKELIEDVGVLKYKHDLLVKRIQDLEISQGQVRLDLKECIDDVKRISIDKVQENTVVQEKIASHEKNLELLKSVLHSTRKNIESVYTALYHQKLLTQYLRGNEDTLARLSKLETHLSAISQAPCVAGFYSSTGLAPCTLCEIGSYQASVGSTSCTPCGVGSYQASAGSSFCTPCEAGSYQASVGSSSCTLCEMGSYQTSVGSTSCTPCEVGSYQASTGSISCTACDAGTSTTAMGSTADTDCTVVSSCPSGYHRLGLKCYAIIRARFTWLEAQETCRIFGGYLAEIKDSSEYSQIKKWLAQVTIPFSDLWIGGSDLLIEGQWVYPGSTASLNYTKWAGKQPDNYQNNEHCLELNRGVDFDYNDKSCSSKVNPLCESRLT